MTNLVERTLYRLGERLPGRRVSTPSVDGNAAATAIWSKPVGRMPRAVVHYQTGDDVQLANCRPRLRSSAIGARWRAGSHEQASAQR